MTDELDPSAPRRAGAVISLHGAGNGSPSIDAGPAGCIRIDTPLPVTTTTTTNIVAGGSSGRLLAIAAGVALAAAAFLTMGFRADTQLSYELRGGSSQGGVIAAERGEATVSLSDGSSILAENQTKFSVDVLGRNAALTRLVSGRLHVRVQHNDDTSYRFLAGPYEVRVVGTEFDLAWDPDASGLSLSMSKGEVRVVEPGGKLHSLKAGETLRLPNAVALGGAQ